MFDRKIKIFQSDGGKEFDNDSLKDPFIQNGIYFRKSCPKTPEQNGVAQRKHRYIIGMTCTLLLVAQFHGQFWVDAAYAAPFIINWLPAPLLDGHSPYEKLFHKTPNCTFLRVFGCECFPTILNNQNKFEPRSTNCVFLSYASHYNGYRCLDPTRGRAYVSRHVLFHEDAFPYPDLQSQESKAHDISPLNLISIPNPFPLDVPVTSLVSDVPSSSNPSESGPELVVLV